jgi:hypothetical protein
MSAYVVVPGMWLKGGDQSSPPATSLEQAYEMSKTFINGDSGRCTNIENNGSPNSFTVWMKQNNEIKNISSAGNMACVFFGNTI